MRKKNPSSIATKSRSNQTAEITTGRIPDFLFVPAFHLFLICLAGIAVYANTLNSPFVLDDITSITNNAITRNFQITLNSRIVNYLSLALNYRLHGLDVTGYHVVNLCIHLANAILVYTFLTLIHNTPRLKESALDGREKQLIALFSSLLFVCHPVQTQAVTYISQRATCLATMFYLATHILFLAAHSNRSRSWSVALGIAAFATTLLAMATKEIAFTLPLTLLLVEFIFFPGMIWLKMRYLSLLFLPALFVPLALIRTFGATGSPLELIAKITTMTPDISRVEYLFTQLRVIITYFRLLVVPVGQNVDYDYPVFKSVSPAVLASFLVIAAILALSAYLVVSARSRKKPELTLIAFGLFWFFTTLSIESSIIPLPDVIFEHRIYLPSVGFFTAVVCGLLLFRRSLQEKANFAARLVLPLLAMVVLVMAGAAVARNTVWQDEVTFWEDVVAKSPLKARVHGNLGNAYQNQGRLEEAMREYREVIRLQPEDPGAHINLGTGYYRQRRWQEAALSYREAVRLDPGSAAAHYNLGRTLTEQGRLIEAEKAISEAIRLKPGHDAARNSLGIVYFKMQRYPEALNELRRAVSLNPANGEAVKNVETLERALKGEKH